MPLLALGVLVAIAAALLLEMKNAAANSSTGGTSDTTPSGDNATNESGGILADVEGAFTMKLAQTGIDFAHGIAFGEGGIDANDDPTTNLPARVNNPGDLELGDVGNGVQAGKTIFSAADPTSDVSNSADDGWARLYHQVWLIASGKSHFTLNMSFSDFAAYYVNGAVNKANQDSANWARNVTSYLQQKGYSVTPASQLSEVLNA